MSIGNKIKFLLLSVVFLFGCSLTASALSIRVLEGGIPLLDPQKIVEDGIRQGNVELLRKAWKHYEEAMRGNQDMGEGYLELGKIYFHLSLLGQSTQSDFDTAEFYARQAIEKNPENSDAHRALGLILAGRGAYLDAFEELTLALYLKPGNEFLICDLASLHWRCISRLRPSNILKAEIMTMAGHTLCWQWHGFSRNNAERPFLTF
jgi:tetratricopeptide (TPR) repeat protein